jgi:hypothetical protein
MEGLMTKPDTKTDALLDELLQGCESPEEILGEHGLLKSLTKRLVERALAAELTTLEMGSSLAISHLPVQKRRPNRLMADSTGFAEGINQSTKSRI